MGQLGGKGNDPVVLLRGREGNAPKAQVQEKVLHRLQLLRVRLPIGRQNHGSAHIEVLHGGDKPAPLPAGHGVSAHIGKAPLPGDGGDSLHYHSLHAAQIHQNPVGGDGGGMLPGPVDGGSRPNGQQHNVALGQGLLRQGAVTGAAHPGQLHGLPVQVNAIYAVAGALFDALCHRPANQAQPHNSNVHISYLFPLGQPAWDSARVTFFLSLGTLSDSQSIG